MNVTILFDFKYLILGTTYIGTCVSPETSILSIDVWGLFNTNLKNYIDAHTNK